MINEKNLRSENTNSKTPIKPTIPALANKKRNLREKTLTPLDSTEIRKIKTKPKTRKTAQVSGCLSAGGWRTIFAGFVLIVIVIALAIPKQTPEQRFYFRIVLSLSVSGLAAIIPGFLDLEFKWLRLTLRAGGAIGIFVFLCMLPTPRDIEVIPALTPDRDLETLTVPTLMDITGRYEYICTAIGCKFSHGKNQHGGKAYITVTPTTYGLYISAGGDREWVANYKGSKVHKAPVNPPSSWRTYKGYQIDIDEFGYEYRTQDKEGESTGRTCLKVIRENGKVVRLEGTFERCTPDKTIRGTVLMIPISAS